VRYKLDELIGPYLRLKDVVCRCGRPDCTHQFLDDPYHARSLIFYRKVGELLSSHIAHVTITSAMRCPEHNQAVRGSLDSAHVHRCAIDLAPEDGLQRLWHECEAANFFGGMLYYPDRGFIHLDLHPSDLVRRGLWGDAHVQTLGQRQGSGLEPIFEWNRDETMKPPEYIRHLVGTNSEVGRCPSK
jgi:hypothetical protein